MADSDLDVVIRQLAKQLHAGLMSRAKQRRDRFNAQAASARSKEVRERYKHVARTTMELATAAAKRLQMSADNVADSYARAMRLAASATPTIKPSAGPIKKKVTKTSVQSNSPPSAKGKRAKKS
jgi:hypothetical protein